MGFAFLGEEGFELGTRGRFNSETDTDNKLDFYHYSRLARISGLPAPYKGAYCMGINLAGGVNDALVQEDDDWDTAAGGTIYISFQLFLSRSLTMANNNEFVILTLRTAADVQDASMTVHYSTANGVRLGIGQFAAGAQFLPISLGQWHHVEFKAVIDSGVGNDGTIDAWLDGGAFTQVTGLDQAAITYGQMGAFGIDAGTTAGYVLFDDIKSDDARLYPTTRRFPTSLLMTGSGHACVGPCIIENVSLLSGAATDNVLTIYDTDTGNTNDATKTHLELKNVTNSDLVDPAGMPIRLERGCYVNLAGTTPRAIVNIGWAPAYGSDGAIREYGTKRKQLPGDI